MSNKGWRNITVDGLVYRWVLQDKPSHKGAATFQRIIAIRDVCHPNSKCAFVSDEIGYFWLGSNSHALIVTPKLVAACIHYALQHGGWDPEHNKQDHAVNLNRELLSQLLSNDRHNNDTVIQPTD